MDNHKLKEHEFLKVYIHVTYISSLFQAGDEFYLLSIGVRPIQTFFHLVL